MDTQSKLLIGSLLGLIFIKSIRKVNKIGSPSKSAVIKNIATAVLNESLRDKDGFVKIERETAYFDSLNNAKKATKGNKFAQWVDVSKMPDWKEYFHTPYFVTLLFTKK